MIGQIALIAIAVYCFSMWALYTYRDRFDARFNTDEMAEIVSTFTYRVGLVGTIAVAALYLGD